MQLYNFKMSLHFRSMKVCLNKYVISHVAFTYNAMVKKYGRGMIIQILNKLIHKQSEHNYYPLL